MKAGFVGSGWQTSAISLFETKQTRYFLTPPLPPIPYLLCQNRLCVLSIKANCTLSPAVQADCVLGGDGGGGPAGGATARVCQLWRRGCSDVDRAFEAAF